MIDQLDKLGEFWPYLLPLVAMLAAGKALRRLLLLPFEWLARKTPTKVDDVLVSEVGSDLGLDKSTLDKANDNADR